MSRSICSIAECGRTVVGRGYCGMHYQRWKKHGDPNVRFQYWPPEMVWRLDELLDRGWSDERIGRALGRSASAVRKARLRLNLTARYRRAYTSREISRILGVNSMVPLRWIRDARLKARRTEARYGRHRVWQISEDALMAFLEDPSNWHCWTPEAIVDPLLREWAVELRGDVRFISVKEAAHRLGVHYMTVWHWVNDGALAGGRDGGIVWVDEQAVIARIQQLEAVAS